MKHLTEALRANIRNTNTGKKTFDDLKRGETVWICDIHGKRPQTITKKKKSISGLNWSCPSEPERRRYDKSELVYLEFPASSMTCIKTETCCWSINDMWKYYIATTEEELDEIVQKYQ